MCMGIFIDFAFVIYICKIWKYYIEPKHYNSLLYIAVRCQSKCKGHNLYLNQAVCDYTLKQNVVFIFWILVQPVLVCIELTILKLYVRKKIWNSCYSQYIPKIIWALWKVQCICETSVCMVSNIAQCKYTWNKIHNIYSPKTWLGYIICAPIQIKISPISMF